MDRQLKTSDLINVSFVCQAQCLALGDPNEIKQQFMSSSGALCGGRENYIQPVTQRSFSTTGEMEVGSLGGHGGSGKEAGEGWGGSKWHVRCARVHVHVVSAV